MSINDWISPLFLKKTDKLAENYVQAEPFAHASLTGFLKEDKVQELQEAVASVEFFRKESDLFSFYQSNDLLVNETPVIKDFITLIQSKEFMKFIKDITGIKVKTADAMAAVYTDTDHLLCHDDRLEGRKVAYVLNLSQGFTPESGGALTLLNSDKKGAPTDVAKRLVPIFNTLTLFTVSKTSHHTVEEVLEDRQRLTIGGWLHG